MSGGTKVDNRPAAHAAKLDLRRRVLAAVPAARVFEGFCGPSATGGMSEVWVTGAAIHVGCDKRFAWPDPRRRYVGDTHRVLRSIDLAQYNVFDLDAYGSPWPAMMILLERRRWQPGELGAIVLTDGGGMKAKFGTAPPVTAALLGMSKLPPIDSSETIHTACTLEWMRRTGVDLIDRWIAVSGGTLPMVYSAVVFEGARGN